MIAGQAFTDVMNSFVVDVILPMIGGVFGKRNLRNLFIILKRGNVKTRYDNYVEAWQDEAIVLPYGRFLKVSILLFFCIENYSFSFFGYQFDHFHKT